MKIYISVFLLHIFCFSLEAQTRFNFESHRIQNKPTIDGHLDEKVWQQYITVQPFTQIIPSPDSPSLYKTELAIVYDDQAIYIAAKLYQNEDIQTRQLCARDQLGRVNADIFTVFLDTYHDKQNGFAFKVSSAGVLQDERLLNGNENGDIGWDAIWQAHVSHDKEAWYVEMEIPFSALRFSDRENQDWGLNFSRLVRKKNETSYWAAINQQMNGFLTQTGTLLGLSNVKPPIRLFLYPYVSSGFLHEQNGETSRNKWLKSGGMDIKYGLSESFTLDLTLIPDFSQVISDNLVRNLSPFEQLLNENRPFFTEGTELFNKADMFYSRRIGARPSSFYEVQAQYADTSLYNIEKNPNITSLINSVKISGRNKNKLGIGFFNALAAPMHAKIFNKQTQQREFIETEALSNYNVFVLDQSFKGQSYINFTNTLKLSKQNIYNANVSGLQWFQYLDNEKYLIKFVNKLSQQGKQFEKRGTYTEIQLSKVYGNTTYSLNALQFSPSFNQSSMGLQYDYNHSIQTLSYNHRNFKPRSKKLQLTRQGASIFFTENIVPFQLKQIQANVYYFWLLKNFYDITIGIESQPKTPLDFYQLRFFNKKMFQYPYLYAYLNGSTDSRKKLFYAYYIGYGQSNEKNTEYFNTDQSIRYQFSRKIDLTISGALKRDNNNIGFAFYDQNINEPIVGRRDVFEYSGEISLKYNISPDINFSGRFRHYNSFISYNSFHTVENNGQWRNTKIDYKNGYDENFNLQNIDLFFNWIFKPGSRIVISYKQWLNDYYILNNEVGNTYFKNVYQIIKKPKSFELSFRVIYFLDYNKIKKSS
ncbi:MAG: DUF5916 domain-containing protein [Chitinophagaceae bacterium]